MFRYFDPMYYIYMAPVLLLMLAAKLLVSSRFAKYSKLRNMRGMTGRQAAESVLRENGVYDVSIGRVNGKLSDHYDPKARVIRLSDGVYDTASVAAVGIAAHEAGHAVQHAGSYAPLKIRNAIIPVCNIGSSLSIPIIIAGAVLNFPVLIYAGLLLFSLLLIFQLITLPVEFNASARALRCIDEAGLLSEDEQRGAKKVLTAAAMTYVAAVLQSLVLLLYYFARFSGNKRR